MKINGLKVVDPTKPLVVHITSQDVKRGATKDPGGCAAALACRREVAGCTQARVHIGRTYIQLPDKWLRFKTPGALRAEIIAFDRGGTFAPGVYQLRPMSPSDRAIGKAQGSYPKKKVRKGPPRKFHTVTGVRHHGANR